MLKAGRYTIELRELSWWDEEELKSSMASGAKMDNGKLSGINGAMLLEIKVQKFKKAIVSIKEGDKIINFSEQWMKELTREEGEIIDSAVDEQSKKK